MSTVRRPKAIQELAQLATTQRYDPSRDLKDQLRAAEHLRKQGKEAEQGGDLETAFVDLARAATIMLDNIPRHPQYYKLSTSQKEALAGNGKDLLEKLERLKPRINDAHERWVLSGGEAAAARAEAEAAEREEEERQREQQERQRQERRRQAEEERARLHDEDMYRRRDADERERAYRRKQEEREREMRALDAARIAREQARVQKQQEMEDYHRSARRHDIERQTDADERERAYRRNQVEKEREMRAPEAAKIATESIQTPQLAPEGTITIDTGGPVNTSGAFCDLFTGTHPIAGKVALKRLRGTSYTDAMMKKIEIEAGLWIKLNHPRILKFLSLYTVDEVIYLVSPFAEFGSLPSYLASSPGADRGCLVTEIAEGLAYLHQFEPAIVHGDVKGNNVLIGSDHHVRICDFGLARHVDTRTATDLKGAGSTPWQSPETLRGVSKSLQSDVYAFGITIYEILSGKVPFSDHPSTGSIIAGVLFYGIRPPLEPSSAPDGAPYSRFWSEATRCWSDRPAERPSMADVLQSLKLSTSPDSLKSSNPASTPTPNHLGAVPELHPAFSITAETSSGPGSMSPDEPPETDDQQKHHDTESEDTDDSRPDYWTLPRPSGSSQIPSYPGLVTISPPPQQNQRPVEYTQLMTPHQMQQGYRPSTSGMFMDPAIMFAESPPGRPVPVASPPKSGLRTVELPGETLHKFMRIAAVNTERKVETCGLLLGRKTRNTHVVESLLIPRQTSDENSCTMTHEELISEFQERVGLLTLGWIHTHPTQSCFMSSLDLHIHSAFQAVLPEAFAIVCAPKSNPSFGIFCLSDPPGLQIIMNCNDQRTFHPHPPKPIYTDADSGHVRMMHDLPLEIADLRNDF